MAKKTILKVQILITEWDFKRLLRKLARTIKDKDHLREYNEIKYRQRLPDDQPPYSLPRQKYLENFTTEKFLKQEIANLKKRKYNV